MGNSVDSSPYVQYTTQAAPKMLGIGLNYLKEGMPGPKNPIIFLKSWSTIAYNPKQLHLPLIDQSKLIHELQLGVMIKGKAFRVKKEDAMSFIRGYFIAIDITDTSKGKPGDYVPETLIKSQDNFCPVSPLISQQVDPYKIQLQLKVNGQTRQRDLTSKMYFKIDAMIEYITRYISLNEGDLILTGTPLGAAPIRYEDMLECYGRVDGQVVAEMKFTVAK